VDDSFQIVVDNDPGEAGRTRIAEEIRKYNALFVPDDHHQLLAVYVYDPSGELVGGLTGGTYWDCLHIDYLWVREDARRSGCGKAMMAAAEAEAVRRGCRHAHVDTIDFQAPDFYPRLGYIQWGVLEDIPPGHRRIFFRKDLV